MLNWIVEGAEWKLLNIEMLHSWKADPHRRESIAEAGPPSRTRTSDICPMQDRRRAAHLAVGVLLEEGEQQQEALVAGDTAVALLQPLPRGRRLAVVDAHVQRLPLERQPRQVLHL